MSNHKPIAISLKIIAIDEECQAFMFVFLWRVLHPDTWQVCSTGALSQRKPVRQLIGSPTAVAEREQHNQISPDLLNDLLVWEFICVSG